MSVGRAHYTDNHKHRLGLDIKILENLLTMNKDVAQVVAIEAVRTDLDLLIKELERAEKNNTPTEERT